MLSTLDDEVVTDSCSVTCPRCGYRDADAWDMDLSETDWQAVDCGSCGAPFLAMVERSATYYSRPSPSEPVATEGGAEHG